MKMKIIKFEMTVNATETKVAVTGELSLQHKDIAKLVLSGIRLITKVLIIYGPVVPVLLSIKH